MGKRIIATNSLQDRYAYELVKPAGEGFHEGFEPDLSPAQMLKLGVFGGWYFLDGIPDEFPQSWFEGAPLSEGKKDPGCNYFKTDASQSLDEWRRKGWIYPEDPYGWFQWYCRYWMGRRIPGIDEKQISRWRAIRRHLGQLRASCAPGDTRCRPRQRQALLHWAYDTRSV